MATPSWKGDWEGEQLIYYSLSSGGRTSIRKLEMALGGEKIVASTSRYHYKNF